MNKSSKSNKNGDEKMFEFVIIGAGVVGGMTARELARYTDNLCILERGC